MLVRDCLPTFRTDGFQYIRLYPAIVTIYKLGDYIKNKNAGKWINDSKLCMIGLTRP